MLKHRWKQLAAVLCAAVTLTSVPAYAAEGPGVTPITGSGSSQTGPGVSGAAVYKDNPNNYYYEPMASPVVQPADLYSYSQMVSDIRELEKRYPDYVTVNVIGRSADGRDIYDVVVSGPKANKNLMIQAGIHGREYITVPLLMKQMEQLLAGMDSGTYNGKKVSSILGETAIHFLPMTNPDGISISQQGEEAVSSESLRQILRDAYAADTADGRTTLPYADYLVLWKNNARGVDLNHNFDKEWDSLNETMNHVSYADYKGSAPLSEPEAAALAQLVSQVDFDACVSYHAMGEVLYWDTADNKASAASLLMAQTASALSGYQILSSPGRGGLKDWMQTMQDPVPGITVEVGRTSCPVNFEEFDTIMAQTQAIPAAMAELISSSSLR